jgi:hypothetical protein
MNHKNLSVTSVFSAVKKQKNFGTTPESEVKHLKKWPEGSAEAAQTNKRKGILQ